ncbi:MAG: hypothetical protein HYX92_00880 [Chloroflexi bacterium]|nr:hypothetical protein [Chloroflexota bacterium]
MSHCAVGPRPWRMSPVALATIALLASVSLLLASFWTSSRVSPLISPITSLASVAPAGEGDATARAYAALRLSNDEQYLPVYLYGHAR